jgi:hypothetical protein
MRAAGSSPPLPQALARIMRRRAAVSFHHARVSRASSSASGFAFASLLRSAAIECVGESAPSTSITSRLTRAQAACWWTATACRCSPRPATTSWSCRSCRCVNRCAATTCAPLACSYEPPCCPSPQCASTCSRCCTPLIPQRHPSPPALLLRACRCNPFHPRSLISPLTALHLQRATRAHRLPERVLLHSASCWRRSPPPAAPCTLCSTRSSSRRLWLRGRVCPPPRACCCCPCLCRCTQPPHA